MNKAEVQSTKEPNGLLWADGKWQDGVTLILWAKGRCHTWDVTVPDTFSTSHIASNFYLSKVTAQHAATLQKTNSRHRHINLYLSNWNQRCIQFWRVGVRQENWGSSIQYITRKQRDRLPDPAYIICDPERSQYLIFWIFLTMWQ